MKKISFFIIIASSFVYSHPIIAKEAPLTGLALQQIQARDFETTTDVLFPSVMTVLQDSGYRISEADKNTGFITGVGSQESKTTYNIFWGFGKKKLVPMVSVFVEQRGPGVARARLNFVMSKAKSRKVYTDETPITDPAVYKDAFERIEKELFIRQSMNATTSTAATGMQLTKVQEPEN